MLYWFMGISTGKKFVPLYMDKALNQEIMVYAAETGTTIQDVVKPVTDEAIQSILRLVADIKEMRKQAYIKQLQEEEAQRIAAENPLQVTGHEVEPIPAQ